MKELKYVREYLRSNGEDVLDIVKAALSRHTSLEESLEKLDIEKHHPLRSVRATQWLYEVLMNHEKLLTREQQLRMFRCAVEKELNGKADTLTEMERLYLAVTTPGLAGPERRLVAALFVVVDLKLEEEFADVEPNLLNVIEKQRARQHARTVDPKIIQTFIKMVEETRRPIIDNFACAVSLEELKLKSAKDVVDDNEGCCPICQLSYTDLSSRELEHLIDDYPVTIKYCGHTLGKACLEQWMRTKKIDEARYPHRTCPICRIKIEGVKLPQSPLYEHMKHNRRMQETMRQLVYQWGMEVDECFDRILAIMNEEIAVEELGVLIREKTKHSTEPLNVLLRAELNACTVWLDGFRDMWGFRGDAAWTKLKKEWQAKRVDKSMGEGEDVFSDDERE